MTPPDWERVVVLFEDFSTVPTATDGPAPGSLAQTLDHYQHRFRGGDGVEQFDLWLDELALVCKGTCAP